jgi:predicted nuclease of predicted toxin-antitoxin system
MRVLLDECVPRKLKRELAKHEVLTVTENGWSGIKNGELLALAEAEFDVFLTVDQNLSFQQKLKGFDIGIIL